MKKILVVGALLLLSSCTFGQKTPTSFDEYYARSVKSTVASTSDTLQSLGLFRSSEVSGVFDAAVSVPVLLSGALSSEYLIQSDGKNSSIKAEKGSLQYTGLAGSGFLSFDEIGLISEAGNIHLLYNNIRDMGLSTPEMRAVFDKYNNTWLSWTQADAREGITDPTEAQAMNALDNISKMDMTTIEKYLLDYPLWKSTEDLGMSGGIQQYKVELHRDNLLSLIDTVKKDLTSSGLTEEEKTRMREELQNVNFGGTLGFDPKDPDALTLDMIVSGTGSETIAHIVGNIQKGAKSLTLSDAKEDMKITLSSTDSEERDTFDIVFVQGGAELGKLTSYVQYAGKKFQELSVDVTAQGLTMTLKHAEKDDGKFEGSLVIPVGTLSWNGTTSDKKLTALKLKGVSPVGSLDMDLTASGEMIRGPFVLTMGGQEVMRASVGLIAESEKFRLALDIPQGEGSADMMHAEFGITAQSGDFKKEIKAPTTSKPLQELVDELEKLAPQVFEEEQPQDFQMDDSSFGDSTIDDAMLLDEMDAIDQEIDSLDMNQ